MKIFMTLMSFMSFFLAQGQNDLAVDYALIKEQIVIKGRTNINKFECKLNLDHLIDSLHIKVRQEGSRFDFTGLSINIPVDSFDCRHRMMTSEFRELLKSDEFPHLNLDIVHIEKGYLDQMHMALNLFVSGKTNEELITNSYAKLLGDELLLGGSHKIYLHSYEIEPPRKFLGTVVVKDELDIFFEVTLMHKYNKGEP